MVRAGFTSTVSNRKALRVGQEPLDVYRRYMATYSRQQCLLPLRSEADRQSRAQLGAAAAADVGGLLGHRRESQTGQHTHGVIGHSSIADRPTASAPSSRKPSPCRRPTRSARRAARHAARSRRRPYLVTIAEIACFRMVEGPAAAGPDHRRQPRRDRPSRRQQGRCRPGRSRPPCGSARRTAFAFRCAIQDGRATVANVEHERAAVSLQKIMGAIGP